MISRTRARYTDSMLDASSKVFLMLLGAALGGAAMRIILIFGTILMLASQGVAAQTIVPQDGVNSSATLGTAYRSDVEELGAAACISGDIATTGAAQSSFALDQTISEEQLARELGFAVGAKARYGVVEGSAAAEFLKRSTSSAYSISLIYRASYLMPVQKLIKPSLTEIGNRVINNDERWIKTCGDKFVNEIRTGASLYVTVRVDFSSQQQKEQFSSNFSISGPMASATGNLKTASATLSKKSKVTISAFQVGGDVSKVTSVLGKTEADVQAYTDCTLGNFDSCSRFITNVLAYASNTSTGFPSQIATGSRPGAADLSYGVRSYEDIGIYSTLSQQELAAARLARADLAKKFEENFQASLAARRLTDVPMSAKRRVIVLTAQQTADKNISLILPVAGTCYSRLAMCLDEVRALKLEPIPERALAQPSFLDYCLEAIDLPFTGENHYAVGISFMLGSATGRPNSGLYITEENCRTADTQLQRMDSFKIPYLSDLWFVSAYTNLRRLVQEGGGRIRDISALYQLVNLEEIEITNQDIEDVSVLSELPRLKSLIFENNHISDLKPFTNLSQLYFLDLRQNDIVDVAPLAGLDRLNFLKLGYNPIKDITPLFQLSNLLYIDLRNTPITDKQVRDLAAKHSSLMFMLNYPSENEQYGTAEEFMAKWWPK